MSTSTAIRVSAVVFSAGYLTSQFLPTLPEGGYSDDKVLSLLDGSGPGSIALSGYVLAIAGVAFLCFAALLSRKLADHGPGGYASVVSAAGTAYAVMLLSASTYFSSLPMGLALGELPDQTDPMLFRVLSNAGFHALLVPALLAAAVTVVAASLALRGTGLAPAWCSTAGILIAPLLLLGFAWVPQFLVPVWALTIAFTLRPARSALPGQPSTTKISRSTT